MFDAHGCCGEQSVFQRSQRSRLGLGPDAAILELSRAVRDDLTHDFPQHQSSSGSGSSFGEKTELWIREAQEGAGSEGEEGRQARRQAAAQPRERGGDPGAAAVRSGGGRNDSARGVARAADSRAATAGRDPTRPLSTREQTPPVTGTPVPRHRPMNLASAKTEASFHSRRFMQFFSHNVAHPRSLRSTTTRVPNASNS